MIAHNGRNALDWLALNINPGYAEDLITGIVVHLAGQDYMDTSRLEVLYNSIDRAINLIDPDVDPRAHDALKGVRVSRTYDQLPPIAIEIAKGWLFTTDVDDYWASMRIAQFLDFYPLLQLGWTWEEALAFSALEAEFYEPGE